MKNLAIIPEVEWQSIIENNRKHLYHGREIMLIPSRVLCVENEVLEGVMQVINGGEHLAIARWEISLIGGMTVTDKDGSRKGFEKFFDRCEILDERVEVEPFATKLHGFRLPGILDGLPASFRAPLKDDLYCQLSYVLIATAYLESGESMADYAGIEVAAHELSISIQEYNLGGYRMTYEYSKPSYSPGDMVAIRLTLLDEGVDPPPLTARLTFVSKFIVGEISGDDSICSGYASFKWNDKRQVTIGFPIPQSFPYSLELPNVDFQFFIEIQMGNVNYFHPFFVRGKLLKSRPPSESKLPKICGPVRVIPERRNYRIGETIRWKYYIETAQNSGWNLGLLNVFRNNKQAMLLAKNIEFTDDPTPDLLENSYHSVIGEDWELSSDQVQYLLTLGHFEDRKRRITANDFKKVRFGDQEVMQWEICREIIYIHPAKPEDKACCVIQ